MEWLKINLDALKNNNRKWDELEIKKEEITNKDVNIEWLKSLDSISMWNEEEIENIMQIDNKKVEKEEISIIEEGENDFWILKKKTDNIINNISEKKIENKENIKKDEIFTDYKTEFLKENENLAPKISIWNIKEQKKEEQNNNQKEIIEEEELVVEEEEELFSTYKSDFIKKENFILEKIKKIKNLPKTRFWMLILLISFVFIIIAWLFYFDPEHHNINKYRAWFLWLLWQEVQITTENKQKETIINTDNNYSQEIIWTKQNYIWNEYEIKIIDWIENFIYKNKTYTNKDELIKVIKRDKINDFLNK